MLFYTRYAARMNPWGVSLQYLRNPVLIFCFMSDIAIYSYEKCFIGFMLSFSNTK